MMPKDVYVTVGVLVKQATNLSLVVERYFHGCIFFFNITKKLL